MIRPLLIVVSLSSLLFFPLLDAAIKGTVVLLLAGGVCWLLRRDSAATRHLVWATGVSLLLAIPLLSLLLPPWRILPSWLQTRPEVTSSIHAIPHPMTTDQLTTETSQWRPSAADYVGDSPYEGDQPSTTPSEIESSSAVIGSANIAASNGRRGLREAIATQPGALVVFVWFVGCAVVLLRSMMAVIQLRRSQRRCRLGSGPDTGASAIESRGKNVDALRAAVNSAAVQLGLKQPVQILLDPEPSIPVIWGVLRPRLRLPQAAVRWSAEQLRSVLLHELAHIRRKDLWVLAITQCACALHWFNPLVWYAAWRLHVERERACDDLVLSAGVRPSAYAGHLMQIAGQLRPAVRPYSCGLAMAGKSSLERRLVAVLDERVNRRGLARVLVATVLVFGAAAAVPLAMLHATAKQQRDDAKVNRLPAATETTPKHEDAQTLIQIW